MAFTDYDAFLEAKKRMETLELRKADNSLTVDAAYEILLSGQVRKKRDPILDKVVKDTEKNDEALAESVNVEDVSLVKSKPDKVIPPP